MWQLMPLPPLQKAGLAWQCTAVVEKPQGQAGLISARLRLLPLLPAACRRPATRAAPSRWARAPAALRPRSSSRAGPGGGAWRWVSDAAPAAQRRCPAQAPGILRDLQVLAGCKPGQASSHTATGHLVTIPAACFPCSPGRRQQRGQPPRRAGPRRAGPRRAGPRRAGPDHVSAHRGWAASCACQPGADHCCGRGWRGGSWHAR